MSLLEAAAETATFAKLSELTRDSSARLKALEIIIPPSLRSSLRAGPIDGDSWCLLVDNNASAAKLRQLLPAMAAHLNSKGWKVGSIRLRVQMSGNR